MHKLSKSTQIAVAAAIAVVSYLLFGGIIGGLFSTNQSGQNMNQNDQSNLEQASSTQANGLPAVVGSLITVHYVGRLQDGRVFDSSRERGQPFSFIVGKGEVIAGWDKGLIGIRSGEKKTLIIPPSEAYGQVPGHSLQNETLIFDVEILNVEQPQS